MTFLHHPRDDLQQPIISVVGDEIGVGGQEVDREIELVDNALAGSVTTVEQLQVFEPVVRSVAVDVVNGFLGQKFPAKMLLHDVPMLVDIVAAGSVDARVSENDIPTQISANHRAVSARALFFVCFDQVSALKRATAGAATGLRAVKAMAFGGEFDATERTGAGLNAGAPFVRANARTIFGVFTPLFLVGAKPTSGERKGFLAFSALKLNGFGNIVGTAVYGQIREIAFSATKLVRIPRTISRELFRAVSAVKYQCHSPLLSDADSYVEAPLRATLYSVGVL